MLALVMVSTAAGCGHLVKVEPVKIQPIHITVDVNLKDSSSPSPIGDTKPQ